MKLLETINAIPGISNINIKENFSYCHIDAQINGSILVSNVYNEATIKLFFNNICNEDSLMVSVNLEGDSIVNFRNSDTIQNIIINNPSSIFEENYIYTLKIEVAKQISNKNTIYSYKHFCDWLVSFDTLKEALDKYKEILNVEQEVYFHILDVVEDVNFCTKKFIFSTSEENKTLENKCCLPIDRNILLERQKENCFVSSGPNYKMVPDDFYLVNRSGKSDIDMLFDKLCLLLTLTFLSDISEVKEESIFYKLYGYKAVTDELSTHNVKTENLNDFYNIYAWIYHDIQQSTISDKLGMTRNLISLHCKNSKLDETEGNVFTAIKSNFDIYLKENVQRYLEVKNQVSAFVYDMSLKAEGSADTLASIFKNNLMVFVSYFVSIIIVTAMDKGKFVNVFTFEVTTITISILLISWFYRKYTIIDTKKKKERFVQKYKNFKKRYNDILDEANLNSLFADDEDQRSDVEYIENTISQYDLFWKCIIAFFAIVTIALCVTNNTNKCLVVLTAIYNFIISILPKNLFFI